MPRPAGPPKQQQQQPKQVVAPRSVAASADAVTPSRGDGAAEAAPEEEEEGDAEMGGEGQYQYQQQMEEAASASYPAPKAKAKAASATSSSSSSSAAPPMLTMAGLLSDTLDNSVARMLSSTSSNVSSSSDGAGAGAGSSSSGANGAKSAALTSAEAGMERSVSLIRRIEMEAGKWADELTSQRAAEAAVGAELGVMTSLLSLTLADAPLEDAVALANEHADRLLASLASYEQAVTSGPSDAELAALGLAPDQLTSAQLGADPAYAWVVGAEQLGALGHKCARLPSFAFAGVTHGGGSASGGAGEAAMMIVG